MDNGCSDAYESAEEMLDVAIAIAASGCADIDISLLGAVCWACVAGSITPHTAST